MNILEQLQERMEAFVKARNWTVFHSPKNLAMSIAIEAAELMEIYQWMDNPEALDRSINDEGIRSQLEDEIADVIIYCLSLANVTHLDLKSVIEKKMDRNEVRFPSNHKLN